jgi:hypothetical protein
MPNWITQIVSSRGLSLLIGAAYLVIVCLSAQPRSAAKILASLLITFGALLLPLACIWFGDELGEYVGAFPGPAIMKKTPGGMLKVGGWFLLLLPVIAGLISYSYT